MPVDDILIVQLLKPLTAIGSTHERSPVVEKVERFRCCIIREVPFDSVGICNPEIEEDNATRQIGEIRCYRRGVKAARPIQPTVKCCARTTIEENRASRQSK